MATMTMPRASEIKGIIDEVAEGKHEKTLFRGGLIVLGVVAAGIVLRDLICGDCKHWD